MIDPFFGTALGVAGSLLGSLFSKKSSDKQLRMQVAENQKNRDFNAEQADIQRDFITKQIADQNAYNSPSAVVERLKSAGLNPNLAYQQIGAGQQISNFQGSAASSSGSVGAGLPDFSGFNSIMQAAQIASNIELQKSQADKNAADAENTRKDTETKQITNNFLPQILQGQIELNGTQIDLNTKQANLTSQQIQLINQQCELINNQIDQIRSTIRINNLTEQQLSESMPYIIKELAARSSLTEQQAQTFLVGLMSQLGLNQSIASLNLSQAQINNINSEFLPRILSTSLLESQSRRALNWSNFRINNQSVQNLKLDWKITRGKNGVYYDRATYDEWYNGLFDGVDWLLQHVPFHK